MDRVAKPQTASTYLVCPDLVCLKLPQSNRKSKSDKGLENRGYRRSAQEDDRVAQPQPGTDGLGNTASFVDPELLQPFS